MGQINTNNYPTVDSLADADLLIVENATHGTGTTTPKQLRENAIGTDTLQTTAQTVTGAINELKTAIDAGSDVKCYDIDTISSGYLGEFDGKAKLLLLHLTADGTADATNGYTMLLSYTRPVARFLYGQLVDSEGVAYKQDVYAENTIICEVTNNGEGTEADPRQVVILGITNAAFTLTPTAVVSDRDIIDGQGNTLSVLAEALTKTASGNPVVITDCAGGKARSLKTTINAIQDLHGYDHPWAGGSGKNKLDASAVTQGTFDDPTSTSNCLSDYIPVTANTAYYMSGNSGYADGIYIRFYDASKVELDTSTRVTKYVVDFGFTAPSTAVYARIMWYKSGGLTPTNIANALVQLEIGSSKTDFAPYSNICPISGRTEARVDTENEDSSESAYAVIQLGTTVYGAEVDFDTGVATVTDAIVDFGDLSWSKIADTLPDSFKATISGKKNASSSSVVDNILCSCYKPVTGTEATTLDNVIGGSTGGSLVYVTDSAYTDATAFKTARTGQTICYKLATPTTLQLTPTQLELLKGYNRVSIDNGSIELGYIAKIA